MQAQDLALNKRIHFKDAFILKTPNRKHFSDFLELVAVTLTD